MSVTLLVVLTVVEILLLVGALAVYVVLVTRRLRSISQNLGRIAFGVRAVETQVERIEPAVLDANVRLRNLATTLPHIAERAEELARR
jgi:uncharacterized protein YoxC